MYIVHDIVHVYMYMYIFTYLHIYIFTYFSFILAKGAIFVCFVQKYFVKVWNCCLIDFEKCCKRIIESILKLLKASFGP